MDDQWDLLSSIEAKEHNGIEGLAHIPVDSPWFSGHFPGEPILPGVALVHITEQAIVRDAASRGEEIQLDGLKRVRFSQPVRPGETLAIHITGESVSKEILYTFKLASKGNVVCSGLIVAKRIKTEKLSKKDEL